MLLEAPDQAPVYLGRTEVTWAQYAARVPAASAAQQRLADELGLADPAALDDHPVVHVGCADAAAYCAALGLRLPTPGEWRTAATLDGTRRYPWGDEPASERARVDALGAAAVATHPADAAPCGALDLAGNVREWCLDAEGTEALGGGSWNDAGADLDVAVAPPRFKLPRGNDTIGFRVALPAP